jgi:hypothetical protein
MAETAVLDTASISSLEAEMDAAFAKVTLAAEPAEAAEMPAPLDAAFRAEYAARKAKMIETRYKSMSDAYDAAILGFDYTRETPNSAYALDLALADPKTLDDRKRLHDWILVWYNHPDSPPQTGAYDDYAAMINAAIRAGSVDGLSLLFHGVYYDRDSPDFDSCILEAAARGTPATLRLCLWALETFAQLNPSELELGELLAAARDNPETHAVLCAELLGDADVCSFVAWSAGHCNE